MRDLSSRLLIIALVLLPLGQSAIASGSAVFMLVPVGQPVEVGKPFTVNLNINPATHAVDTARASLSFSAELLTANSFGLSGKLTSTSPGGGINNSAGTISGGGFTVSNPIVGTSGSFARVTFTPKAVGEATVRVMGDSKLIDNGEEVGNPSGFNQIKIKIIPSTTSPSEILQLTSPTHPNQDKWYQANAAEFRWAQVGTGQYTWEIDQSPTTVPTRPITDRIKQIRGIRNGVWYFHLGALLAGNNNPPVVAHYRVQVDNLKPNSVEPYLDVSDISDPFLKFATTDYHSGMAGYDLQINQRQFANAVSPYKLSDLNVGRNFVMVTASDIAGNENTGWIKFILDANGSIHDITTSRAGFDFCSILPVLCAGNNPIAGLVAIILLIGLLVAFFWRRRVHVDVKTVTHTDTTIHTDPKTGKKIVTEKIVKTDTKNLAESDTYGIITKPDTDSAKPTDHHKK